MIELIPDDFRSLDEAEMQRLWMGAHFLSSKDFTRLHMLTQDRATSLWNQLLKYSKELFACLFKDVPNLLPDDSLFSSVQRIHMNYKNNGTVIETGEAISIWLSAIPCQDTELIVVMFETKVAVITDWKMFREHWDAIWLDDVIVYPLSTRWILLYYHEDIIAYGLTRKPVHYDPRIFEPALLPIEAPDEEVLRLYRDGKKVDAIKLYHDKTGYRYPFVLLQNELKSYEVD